MMTDIGGISRRRLASRNEEKKAVLRDWFQRLMGGLHVYFTMATFTPRNRRDERRPSTGMTGQAMVPTWVEGPQTCVRLGESYMCIYIYVYCALVSLWFSKQGRRRYQDLYENL